MIRIDGNRVRVETRTLVALLEAGRLTSLVDRRTGERLVADAAEGRSALALVFASGAVDVVGRLAAEVTVLRLSDRRAQFRLHGWDGDGIVDVSEDPESGDLVIEPSAQSARPGLVAVRWSLRGVDPALDLVAPFFQGTRLPSTDSLLQRRWNWPYFWEAGLAILQGKSGGLWLHCRDTAYRYKALDITGGVLGLETDAYGPADSAMAAGGLAWRINVHQGDWQVPARRYRDWMETAFGFAARRSSRAAWAGEIRLALCWFGGDREILEAVSRKVDPRRVLVHFSEWRTDPYDENYPTFQATGSAKDTFAWARAVGMHLMPHCNAIDMDPTHPTYALLRDFQYRDAGTSGLLGWGWDPDSSEVLGVPGSGYALSRNRRRKVMVKIHPGLSMWRSILSESILRAVDDVGTDTVFVDVTLHSMNLRNCLVESMTSSEGMLRLIDEVGSLGGGLAVGGEGLNEVTACGLTFAQAHLFLSWQTNVDGMERASSCPLGAYLFGDVCRTIGYSSLSGATEAEVLRMRCHAAQGAVPTITVRSAREIERPNAAVREALERARS